MSEEVQYSQPYEPLEVRIKVPDLDGFNDFEMVMLQVCIYVLDRAPMWPTSRPLTAEERARIVGYLSARYSP